jgi:hypothetical protein
MINPPAQAREYLSPIQLGQADPEVMEKRFGALRVSQSEFYRHDLVAMMTFGSVNS